MRNSTIREGIRFLARSAAPGPGALDLVARALSEGLGCRWAGIATTGDGTRRIERLLDRDDPSPDPVADTPVADTAVGRLDARGADGAAHVLRDNLSVRFPDDPLIAGRRILFFAAAPYRDAAGQVAGHVFAMDDRDIARPDSEPEIADFMHTAAARVGAEIAASVPPGEPDGSDLHGGLRGDAPVILWEMGESLDRLSFISSHAEAVLGYPCDSWRQAGAWVTRIHPMDRERALASVTLAAQGGGSDAFEFRMIAADGHLVWLSGTVLGREGRFSDKPGLAGLWIDLTRQKAIQQELADNVRRFRDFAEADTDWFWEMDEHLRFSFLSEQFQEVTGMDPAPMLGRTLREMLAADDAVIDELTTEDEWERHIHVLETHQPFQDFRHPRAAADGTSFYLSISGKPVFDAAGRFKGYRGTGSNITAQVRTERALRESERQLRLESERAEEASRAKSDFLANMSHEIRTPLNAILGFSDSMQREMLGPVGNKKYLEYVGAIHTSGCHLLELVNDILDLSKIEAGRYVLSLRTIDIVDVIDGCLRISRETASRKSIELSFDAAERFPAVTADLRAMKQVILNLLSNALKFTNAGGRVKVSLRLQAADVYITVSDTGVGIPREDIATLTEAFVQGQSNQAYLAHEGTGLGLAITDSLVRLHGGTLTIDSEVGVGTVVTIHLPRAVALSQETA